MMGPKSVTIYDPQPITVLDLGCNFYCHEDHVNKTSRAQACLPQLRRLNKKV
jgi:ubiquitin-activating enzyme E1